MTDYDYWQKYVDRCKSLGVSVVTGARHRHHRFWTFLKIKNETELPWEAFEIQQLINAKTSVLDTIDNERAEVQKEIDQLKQVQVDILRGVDERRRALE